MWLGVFVNFRSIWKWIMWLSGSKNGFYSSKTYFAKKVSKIYKCIWMFYFQSPFFIHNSLLYCTLDVVYLANIQFYDIKKKMSLEINFQQLISCNCGNYWTNPSTMLRGRCLTSVTDVGEWYPQLDKSRYQNKLVCLL